MSEKVKIQFEGEDVDAEEVTFEKVSDKIGQYTLEDGSLIELRHSVTNVFRLCEKQKPDGSPIYLLTGNAVLTAIASNSVDLGPHYFQIANGRSLEEHVKQDVESLAGVQSVQILKVNGRIAVNVFLRELSFEYFPALADKEIELFDSYPELKFDFNMFPASGEQPNLALHAA